MATFTLTACGDGDDESDDNDGDDNGCGKGSFSTEYVDLGLSVKWATCNLGATEPEEYGNYYAWGETDPKAIYNWSTYKYGTGVFSITKYTLGSNGDGKAVLEGEDDAATVNLGGEYRMPTDAEFQELIDKCTWTWVTLNGIHGYQATGPNSKSIFLPAAGYRTGPTLASAGIDCKYWSSSIIKNSQSSARGLWLYSSVIPKRTDHDNRYFGRSIRPVRP